MGPTASGKTAVALELARVLPCEIVSVDSALVYKGMDIGTAKPDRETLEAVPHHLVDVIEPHESYSAARFRDDALAAMREITERGNIPLLVGGTMLYFKALTEGLNELPEADPMIRLVIDTMAQEQRLARGAREAERSRSRHRRAARAQRCAARAACAGDLLHHRQDDARAARETALRVLPVYADQDRARAERSRGAARTHRAALRADARKRARRGSEATARRVRAGADDAVDALRRLPPGVAAPERRDRASRSCAATASPPRASSRNASSRGCARWKASPTSTAWTRTSARACSNTCDASSKRCPPRLRDSSASCFAPVPARCRGRTSA